MARPKKKIEDLKRHVYKIRLNDKEVRGLREYKWKHNLKNDTDVLRLGLHLLLNKED